MRLYLVPKSIKKKKISHFLFYHGECERKSNIFKIIKKNYIFKLFNFYIEESNKWKKIKIIYKNNLLTLNLFFICVHFFFPSIFLFIFFLSHFSSNFSWIKHFLKEKNIIIKKRLHQEDLKGRLLTSPHQWQEIESITICFFFPSKRCWES